MGRFINADSYASTGQGVLGFNMFAYCRNNPVNNIDPTGLASHYVFGFDEHGDLSNPRSQYIGLAGGAVLMVGVVGVQYAIQKRKSKPVNLPSQKKVTPDMEHISSGHLPGGDRNSDGKKSVFWGLTAQQVAKAIMEAYSNASKLQTQGDRIKLIGNADTYNLVIEMWVNIVTYIIETAYPK